MEYTLTIYRLPAAGGEQELRFRAPTRSAAVAAFTAWAQARMAATWEAPVEDPADLGLRHAPVQAGLDRPLFLLELAYVAGPAPHWRLLIVRVGMEVQDTFRYAAGGAAEAVCLRNIGGYLLESEIACWGS